LRNTEASTTEHSYTAAMMYHRKSGATGVGEAEKVSVIIW